MKTIELSHREFLARLRELPRKKMTAGELYRLVGFAPDDPQEFWPDSANSLGRALARLEGDQKGVRIERWRSNGRRLWKLSPLPLPDPVSTVRSEPDLEALID